MNSLYMATQTTVGNLIFAQSAPPTRPTIDPGLSGPTTTRPSGAITKLINDLGWLAPILSAVGALIFVGLIVKMVWDRKNGRGGRGGAIGQTVGAMAALILFFDPTVIGLVADFFFGLVNRLINWFGNVVSSGSAGGT